MVVHPLPNFGHLPQFPLGTCSRKTPTDFPSSGAQWKFDVLVGLRSLGKTFFLSNKCQLFSMYTSVGRSQPGFLSSALIWLEIGLKVEKGENWRFCEACYAEQGRAGQERPTVGHSAKPWWFTHHPTLVTCHNFLKGLAAGKHLPIIPLLGPCKIQSFGRLTEPGENFFFEQ